MLGGGWVGGMTGARWGWRGNDRCWVGVEGNDSCWEGVEGE